MTEEEMPLNPTEQNEEQNGYKDKYLRLLADVDNTRKRMQKEKQEMTRFAVENVISENSSPHRQSRERPAVYAAHVG